MLAQYLEYKAQYPDALLLFQVGDFYEVFFEDAVTVSKTLNLTLTSRDRNNPEPVPMCGVPIAVVEGYLERLVDVGFSVAIVKQVGIPTGKGMVARQLERIVTPGVRLMAGVGGGAAELYTAAVIFDSPASCAAAVSNIESGVISVLEGVPLAAVVEELARRSVSEIVTVNAAQGKRVDLRTGWVRELQNLVPERACKFRVEPRSADEARFQSLAELPGFAGLGTIGRRAVRLLVAHVDAATVTSTLQFRSITSGAPDALIMDAATLTNLEVLRNVHDGTVRGTLFECLNRTVTPLGTRLLSRVLRAPLLAPEEIDARQQFVQALTQGDSARRELRTLLAVVPDIERILARSELAATTPRELGALRDGLLGLPRLWSLVDEFSSVATAIVARLRQQLVVPPKLLALLENSLAEQPPLSTADGEIFRDGFDTELDRLRTIHREGKRWILELETKERESTGIGSLKVRYNGVLGFFIEITKSHLTKVPERYRRKQSMVGGERYTTEELLALEREVLSADEKLRSRERELYETLRREVAAFRNQTMPLVEGVALLDLLLAFAEVASAEGWKRPVVSSGSELVIEQGRHPVLSMALGTRFVPNDAALSRSERCFILTGPNMGGKSTFLRQIAMLVILAQIGSFVPARSMKCGIVDRIFARIGASDNIHEGESTFMVEMREASHILSRATSRSLVLIDELGRGTATTDGLSLAEAILEDLIVRVEARTFFATHFHELTGLAARHPVVRNISVGSEERGDEVLFTHAICEGPASRSYGIDVAKLAGLPMPVLSRARALLEHRLLTQSSGSQSSGAAQLSFFQPLPAPERSRPAPVPAHTVAEREVLEAIRGTDPDDISPRAAHEFLTQIRGRLL
jgi:DNA mismatch repair protein MutS